jgi:glycosidase
MPAPVHSTGELQFRANLQLHPSPADWRDQFIYFLLVDRFDDNVAAVPAYQPGVAAGRDPAQGGMFQGGNLRGVLRRLDYIQGLGCTAIWLSPILKNRAADDSYHGYGIQNFLEVDPHFGTLHDLQELVRAAHERGMYVIMDMVLNHTGDVWQYPGGYPYYYNQGETFPFGGWREQDPQPGMQDDDAVWPQELQQPDAFKRHGQIRDWNDRIQARDGDFMSLKELNLPRPDVLDTLIKVYKHWVDVADVDGFRVDTVKHMEDSSVAIFCNAIREYAQRVGKQRFFLFGEIMDSDDTIQRYIGRNSRIDGTNERFPSLDAALDFPLYFVLEPVIKGFASPAFLRDRYERFYTRYADHGEAGRYFVTFVDNHDRKARFLHDDPYPQQALLAMGYLLTSQGVPCIYYGTEQGFDGGGDSDAYVRECMFGGRWGAFDTTGHHCFDPQHPIYQGIRRIAEIRRQQPALRYGRQYFREISGNGADFGHPLVPGECTLAYSRILDTEEILVCLNLQHQPRQDHITVDRNLSAPGCVMKNLLDPQQTARVLQTDGRAHVQVNLPPHGIALMKCG